MSRTSVMTLGILLIFLGIKLNLVESYQLSPSATRFWMERIEDPAVAYQSAGMAQPGGYGFGANPGYQSPYQVASYSNYNNPALPQINWPPKTIVPPNWLCWPVFFLGAVLLLHGVSLRHG